MSNSRFRKAMLIMSLNQSKYDGYFRHLPRILNEKYHSLYYLVEPRNLNLIEAMISNDPIPGDLVDKLDRIQLTKDTEDSGDIAISPLSSTQKANLTRRKQEYPSWSKSSDCWSDSEVNCEFDDHDTECSISSMRDSTSEIASMYETATQYLTTQVTDTRGYSTLFTQNSDSECNFLEGTNHTNHQSRCGSKIRLRHPQSPSAYPTRLKRPTIQQLPSPLVDRKTLDYTKPKEINLLSFDAYHEILSPFSLRPEHILPALFVQSDKNDIVCPPGLVPPIRDLSISSTTYRTGENYTKQLSKERDFPSTLGASTSSYASMVNFHTTIPVPSTVATREDRLNSPPNNEKVTDFHVIDHFHPESLRSTSQLITSRKSHQSENIFPWGAMEFDNRMKWSSVAKSTKGNSCDSFSDLHKTIQKSVGLNFDDHCAKSLINDKAKSFLDTRDFMDEFSDIQDSQFELSLDSDKSLDCNRASYTTIDRIEMDLNSKKIETDFQKVCNNPLRVLSPHEGISQSTAALRTTRRQDSDCQLSPKFRSIQELERNNLKPLDKKLLHQTTTFAQIFQPNLLSRPTPRNRNIPSRVYPAPEFLDHPIMFTSKEKHLHHGFNTDDSKTKSFKKNLTNQEKSDQPSKQNYLSKPAFNYLLEDQRCTDLEYDQYLLIQRNDRQSRSKLLPINDHDHTDILNLTHQFPSSFISHSNSLLLAPEPISCTRQIRLKNSVPQLMKALPPIPPVEQLPTRINLGTKKRKSNLPHTSCFLPKLLNSQTNSLETGVHETIEFKTTLLSAPLLRSIKAEDGPEVTRSTRSHNCDFKVLRSSPRLKLKMKSPKSFSNYSSWSPLWDFESCNRDCTDVTLQSSAAVPEKMNFSKSSGLRLKSQYCQTPCEGTVCIRKAPTCINSKAVLPHSTSRDFFTCQTDFSDIFRNPSSNMQLKKLNIASNNLKKQVPLPISKPWDEQGTMEEKLIDSSDLQKDHLLSSESHKFSKAKYRVLDDDSHIKGHERFKKKIFNLRFGRVSPHVKWRDTQSKDENTWRNQTSEATNSNIPVSSDNSYQTNSVSNPAKCYREKPQGRFLKIRIRDWIKRLKSTIIAHKDSQTE